MARILRGAHDFSTLHGNAKYPWAEWADGRPRAIKRGEDFDVEPKVMQGQVKVRGAKEGLLTVTSVVGDEVWFCFSTAGETADEFARRVKPRTAAAAG